MTNPSHTELAARLATAANNILTGRAGLDDSNACIEAAIALESPERVALTPQEIVHAGWSGRKYAQGTNEGRAFLFGALFAQEYHGIGTSAGGRE